MEELNALLHGQIMAMVQERLIDENRNISVTELSRRLSATIPATNAAAFDLGYRISHAEKGWVINLEKTIEEIEALKEEWAKDPIWDIEETDGFEAYAEELLVWREARSQQIESKIAERNATHAALVREQTGVLDADIVSSLHTWNEIEFDIKRAEANAATHEVYLQAAQVRATLLQAAQLKRIADALASLIDLTEASDSRDSLAESVKIWGTEK